MAYLMSGDEFTFIFYILYVHTKWYIWRLCELFKAVPSRFIRQAAGVCIIHKIARFYLIAQVLRKFPQLSVLIPLSQPRAGWRSSVFGMCFKILPILFTPLCHCYMPISTTSNAQSEEGGRRNPSTTLLRRVLNFMSPTGKHVPGIGSCGAEWTEVKNGWGKQDRKCSEKAYTSMAAIGEFLQWGKWDL